MRRARSFAFATAGLLAAGLASPTAAQLTARQAEALDRGVVAIRKSTSEVYVGWRSLGLDDPATGFNLYRSTNGGAPLKLNSTPLTQTTDFVDSLATQLAEHTYFVRPVVNNIERPKNGSFSLPAFQAAKPYLSVPINKPAGGSVNGSSYTYSANDASVGDVDGDGQYEIILKWNPSNATDNASSGYTGNVYIDAYEMDGTQLWRIDMGRNVRAGAHYTQFMVYDLDGDNRAEIAMRAAPGTVDGQGNAVLMGNDQVTDDYRRPNGYILNGPEYMTVFDGQTGAELDSVAFNPARGSVSSWGDNYGNRVDRFLGGVAYLDGQRPSVVMGRGYYGPQSGLDARNEIATYDFRDGQLTQRWHFQAATNGPNPEYIGQGAHSLTIGDVDADGKDEVIYGAMALDDDGSGLYSTQLGTGDALHLADMDPDRPGLEVFMPHEEPGSYQSQGRDAGGEYRDAATGQLLAQIPSNNDVGRGVAGDIDPNHRGYEFWATTNEGTRQIYNVSGQPIYNTPSNMMYNHVIYWDEDLQHELLDGTTISEWNNPGRQNILTADQEGAVSINGTKANPSLQADILGDWREEVIWPNADSTELQVWTTTIKANDRFYTLMHDLHYRVAIAAQNSAYNQPPHLSYFLGDGVAPTPNIAYDNAEQLIGDLDDDGDVDDADFGMAFAAFTGPGNTQTTELILHAVADAKITNDNPSGQSSTDTFGSNGTIELRRLANTRARQGVFSFDLSQVDGDLTGATITFHVSDQPSARTRTVGVYGVEDGAANEAFDQSTVHYQNAPGFEGPYDDGNVHFSTDMADSPLATAQVLAGVLGDYTTTTTAELEAFLEADTNGIVTFSILIDPISNGSALYLLDAMEAGDGSTAIRLTLPNGKMLQPAADFDGDGDVDDADFGIAFANFTGPGTVNIPEPSSLMMLAGAGLFTLRRRRINA